MRSVESGVSSEGFMHDCITRGQRRTHLPAGEHQRKIPRHDLTHNTDRLALHVIEKPGFHRNNLAFDLVGDTAKIAETSGGARYVENP